MTKKDFETIARALKPYYDNYYDATISGNDFRDETTLLELINHITREIKKDNPRFDSIKFLDYLRSN